ncbi:unnamed protein product [Urochloa humidicola]
MRGKTAAVKKAAQMENAGGDKKKSSKTSTKAPNTSIDDQATVLLMRATGVLGQDETPTEEAHQAFGEQFTGPMLTEPVCDIRIALGLPGEGRADVLSALVTESADADD